MKDYVIGIAIGAGVALTVLAPARCEAQTTMYYLNNYGEQVGTARNIGNTTYYYDSYGNQVGTARPIGPPQAENRAYQPIPLMVQPMPTYTAPTQSLTPIYDSIFGK